MDILHKLAGWFIAIGALALIALGVYACGVNYSQFMDECMQDHKRYECEVMWRSSQPDVIYIQGGTK